MPFTFMVASRLDITLGVFDAILNEWDKAAGLVRLKRSVVVDRGAVFIGERKCKNATRRICARTSTKPETMPLRSRRAEQANGLCAAPGL